MHMYIYIHICATFVYKHIHILLHAQVLMFCGILQHVRCSVHSNIYILI